MNVGIKIALLVAVSWGALLSGTDLTVAVARAKASPVYREYDFTLTTMDSKKVKLSDYQGKVVLVNFWATWCGPCVNETPALVRLYNKYQSRGFVVIGVARGSEDEAVREFIKKFDIPYPVGRDSTDEIGLSYGVFAIPTIFLFAPDGSVKRRVEGGYGEQTDEVFGRDVQALLDLTPAPSEPQKSEPVLADQTREESRKPERYAAPKPLPTPRKTPQAETGAAAPEPVLADQTKEEPREPERYAALKPGPTPRDTPQPETGAAEERQAEAAVTYSRWNFIVPFFAVVGLLILSRVRLNVVPVEAAGTASPVPIRPQQSVPYARLLLRGVLGSFPQEIAFLHNDILIGSGTECDVILRHPSIARQHARVQWRKQGYVLCAIQGAQRTFVNGRPIVENLLKEGWTVRLGEVEFVFYDATSYRH